MLLDDIVKNRYRVEQIIQRIMDADDKDERFLAISSKNQFGYVFCSRKLDITCINIFACGIIFLGLFIFEEKKKQDKSVRTRR